MKTLKDLEMREIIIGPLQGRKVVDVKDLKQAAIERIKKIRKDFEKGTAGQTEDYNFMDFFNITEEELK